MSEKDAPEPLPRLPNAGRTPEDQEGVSIVTNVVFAQPERGGLGHAFRENPVADGGVDGQIEILGEEGDPRAYRGRLVAVQIKSGASYFRNDDGDTWSLYINKSTMRYWREHSLPVVLILVDLANRRCFWTRADSLTHEEKNNSFRVRVPKTSAFDATAREPLACLAAMLRLAFSAPPQATCAECWQVWKMPASSVRLAIGSGSSQTYWETQFYEMPS